MNIGEFFRQAATVRSKNAQKIMFIIILINCVCVLRVNKIGIQTLKLITFEVLAGERTRIHPELKLG